MNQPLTSPLPSDPYIFCSLRFTPKVEEAAKIIIAELRSKGIQAVKMDIENGRSIQHEVANAVVESKLVLVLASETWGE